ncbi:ABC transporter ATP-binding protein [Sphingomonas elodea]|uniref:ABC transporter ATP-binding protein n=1 Tax=Sphingomonas elodea TaxID=179878 RepID=UPI0002631005|nr:ABC transporter ATP-binding protein [Sphingomonas elodea]
MITVSDVSKVYPTRHGSVLVLDGVNFDVKPGEKVAFLGRNGAGKSTLVRLISGAEAPTSGTIRREMTVSWPLAFGGAFQSALTGLDNMRFICRLYGLDWKERVAYVEEFSELGAYLKEPVRSYSAGMRARLAFAVSMVVEFDCFLIDEIIAVGDARFHEKCRIELFEKRADRALIIVSHDAPYIRDHCSRVGVLNKGRLTMFDDIDEGYVFYKSIQHV